MPSQREILLCRYHYDALDRLIGHAQPDTPERQRFYCKSRLATEIQGALQHSIFQQGDLLLAQQQRHGDALDTTLLATDQQRSVLHTLEENNQRHPIAYSPYGHRPAESGLTSLLGFNGERPDPVTGHYLLGNGYRAFNPVLMRFNSPDSLSPFDEGGLNSYAYCLGNPVNRSDRTGHLSSAVTDNLFAWLSRARDRISTSFAQALGSSNSPRPLVEFSPRDLATPLANRNLLSNEQKLANMTVVSPLPPQPLSLTDASLKIVNHKNFRPTLRKAEDPIVRRVDQLNNLEGQKIAAKLSEGEPNNTLFKLAANRQLQGGAEWAANLPAQSKIHDDFMLQFNNHSLPDRPPHRAFSSLRLRQFDIRTQQIFRQRDLNLRGR